MTDDTQIDKKVLIRFPGCAGNLPFFFGVLDILQKKVDFNDVAFLTRSGSGYPVCSALYGGNVKNAMDDFHERLRSYFKETGDISTLSVTFVASEHAKLLIATEPNADIKHHIEVLDAPWLTRKWLDNPTPKDKYVKSLSQSSHIPFIVSPSLTNGGYIDGAMRIPCWSSLFKVDNKTIYRHSVKVVFNQYTTWGAVHGLYAADCYTQNIDVEFLLGQNYARTVLRKKLYDCGVHFHEGEDVNADRRKLDSGNGHIKKWSVAENKYIEGVGPLTYVGPRWMTFLNKIISIF
jgi:hypothetical protein